MKETLVTISKRTGFAISTVSRVLNGQAEKYRISRKTVELILAEAGGRTRTLPDDRELLYNEEDLRNPWFVCRSKFSKI